MGYKRDSHIWARRGQSIREVVTKKPLMILLPENRLTPGVPGYAPLNKR